MSGEHPTDAVRQERDRIHTGRLLAIGGIAAVVFAVGITWAVHIQRDATGGIRSDRSGLATHAGEREIGMVYQPPFAGPSIAAEKASLARARLDGYGFVDDGRQMVHIPIDRAMQLLVARGKL